MSNIKILEKPPTDEWNKLMNKRKKIVASNWLEWEQSGIEEWKVLYRKENDGIYSLYDLWNPEKEYDGEFLAAPLNSIYSGYVELSRNTIFSNVVGSSTDSPIFNLSWIGVYKLLAKIISENPDYVIPTCCTNGKYYDQGNDQILAQGCGTSSIGGHIMLWRDNIEPSQCDIVGLLPICNLHNTVQFGNHRGNGTGFYMKTGGQIIMIRLLYKVSYR